MELWTWCEICGKAIPVGELCKKASPETQEVVELMRDEVERECPEFRGLLVPMCEYNGGVCHEMNGCER